MATSDTSRYTKLRCDANMTREHERSDNAEAEVSGVPNMSRRERLLGTTLGAIIGMLLGWFIAISTNQSWQVPVIALTIIGAILGFTLGRAVGRAIWDLMSGL